MNKRTRGLLHPPATMHVQARVGISSAPMGASGMMGTIQWKRPIQRSFLRKPTVAHNRMLEKDFAPFLSSATFSFPRKPWRQPSSD